MKLELIHSNSNWLNMVTKSSLGRKVFHLAHFNNLMVTLNYQVPKCISRAEVKQLLNKGAVRKVSP